MSSYAIKHGPVRDWTTLSYEELVSLLRQESDPGVDAERLELLLDRKRIPKFEHIYSSPLRRARETAQAIADQHGLSIVVLPALREVQFGTLPPTVFSNGPRAVLHFLREQSRFTPVSTLPETDHALFVTHGFLLRNLYATRFQGQGEHAQGSLVSPFLSGFALSDGTPFTLLK